MVDYIKALKLETPDIGTELDMYPTEINPSEDVMLGAGLAIGSNDITITKDINGNMVFKDVANVFRKLSDLVGVAGDLTIDGGFANSIYIAAQSIDGGNA